LPTRLPRSFESAAPRRSGNRLTIFDRMTTSRQYLGELAKSIVLRNRILGFGSRRAPPHARDQISKARLVPVVEPELLMDGEHSLDRCREETEEVLRTVFNQLYTQRVMLEGMLLKPNMVLPGLNQEGLACPKQEEVDEVAGATVKCLLRGVPAAVPGIAFLSGGQPSELASARLNAMNVRFKSRSPWALAFSFARAIQQPALEMWRGKEANVSAAQQALSHRARCSQAARRGEYNAAMETISANIPQLAKPAA
jgi:fructose-bisphosphate aldolase class 1